jgi:hypothetical protein
VTVKTSAGTLKSSQFSWLTSADGTRRELTQMSIANDDTFTGANLTFSAKKTASGGDGRVEVGAINAINVNLGALKVRGSLLAINAGPGVANMPAVKSIDVLAFGRTAGANDLGGSNVGLSTGSMINGDLPLLKIKGDLIGASIRINGKGGTIFIGGSIIGGDPQESGFLRVASGTKSFVVGGSIVGGDGFASGAVILDGQNGFVKVGGSIVGGGGDNSGRLVTSFNPIAFLTVGGSIVGGDGSLSGRVAVGDSRNVVIGGSVIAGNGSQTGVFLGTGAIGKFTLGGSLIGGELAGDFSGALHFATAKSVLIKGSVTGRQGAAPALIGFTGKTNPTTAAESIAVGSLTIPCSATHANILFGEGGIGSFGTIAKGDVGAGKIRIGGDFAASSITAGFTAGADGFYGNADDMPGSVMNAAFNAAIASIVIKGRATGTASDGDHYGIVAESLGTVTIAGRKLALDPDSRDNVLAGIYGDFRVRERMIP